MLEFHAEVPQAIASEGLAQCPYMAARAGFEPTALRMKGDESTNESPRTTETEDSKTEDVVFWPRAVGKRS